MLNRVVVVVVVRHPWSVSPHGHSQSTGTKQKPGGKVLNTGCGNSLILPPQNRVKVLV